MRTWIILAAVLAGPAAAEPAVDPDMLACALTPGCVEKIEADRASMEASLAKLAADAAAPVEARLKAACIALYARQPDETITNPLCFQVFMADGLPD